MAYNYSAKEGESSAKSVGLSLPISTKISIEICNAIRAKPLLKAKKILCDAAELKIPIPMKIYNDNTGHKAGMAAGSYPVNACREILKIIESAEKNAQSKGLSTNDLVLRHVVAQQGPKTWHYGRQKRREAKRTHIEVMLDENKTAKAKKTMQKQENRKDIPEKGAAK